MPDIKLRIHTNTDRKNLIVDSAMTPKEVLVQEDIDFSSAMVHLDGSALEPSGMNKSFDDHGVTDSAIIAVVIKTVNR